MEEEAAPFGQREGNGSYPALDVCFAADIGCGLDLLWCGAISWDVIGSNGVA